MALSQTLRSTKLIRLLPLLSALCILVGVAWLFLLPLDEYSRKTYISENALLPGGVHTYFSGSEHNVFRAYRHEVQSLGRNASSDDIVRVVGDIFRGQGLKAAGQKYSYTVAGKDFRGENVYAVLEAPRGDATEAIVLCAAWLNMDGKLNESGVALVLALARYFRRWSLWSKDVIFLIPSDSRAGPQAWADSYHELHTPPSVSSLPVKSGAIQGVVAIDYPSENPWESIHIVYDGINGQLPNLDLFNTAVHISNHQMGVRTSLQEMWEHDDKYKARLRTMLRGMVNQGLGHVTGPHSAFIPYHIDAVTLQTAGVGRYDDETMGRIVESLSRSLNNLLEHFHQSFFFYLLLAPRRFVSIGTYLPSAMLIAVSFTLTAIGRWVSSARPLPAPPTSPSKKSPSPQPQLADRQPRDLLFPITFVLGLHLLGAIPLTLFNTHPTSSAFHTFCLLSSFLPFILSSIVPKRHLDLISCISLLLFGLFLSTLATLNFSLSLLVGLFSVPYAFVRPFGSNVLAAVVMALLLAIGPATALAAVAKYWGEDVGLILEEAAVGWGINGMWTQVVVWGVWWPAWISAGTVVGGSWW